MITSSSGLLKHLPGHERSGFHAHEPFLHALLAGDQREALAVAIDAQRRGMTYFYDDVVAPAMVEVGRLWEAGRISVADEHLATAVCEATIASLYPSFAWPVSGPPAIVACVASNRHQLGARMVADLLALDGWRVSFLGADVPAPALVEMAAERKPLLVGLSVSLEQHLRALQAAVQDLRRAVPGVRILVGGRAVRGLRDPVILDADAWAGSAGEAVGVAAPWKR